MLRNRTQIWLARASAAALAVVAALSMGGCSISIADDNDTTFGDAFSSLGDAFENAWDQIF